jgi:chromosome segregation ATPase
MTLADSIDQKNAMPEKMGDESPRGIVMLENNAVPEKVVNDLPQDVVMDEEAFTQPQGGRLGEKLTPEKAPTLERNSEFGNYMNGILEEQNQILRRRLVDWEAKSYEKRSRLELNLVKMTKDWDGLNLDLSKMARDREQLAMMVTEMTRDRDGMARDWDQLEARLAKVMDERKELKYDLSKMENELRDSIQVQSTIRGELRWHQAELAKVVKQRIEHEEQLVRLRIEHEEQLKTAIEEKERVIAENDRKYQELLEKTKAQTRLRSGLGIS